MKTPDFPDSNGAIGRQYAYSDLMDECTLCSAPIKKIRALGIYIIAGLGVIRYPMCKRCVVLAQKENGLPPASLAILDQKLEKRATELGIDQDETGGKP